MNDRLHSDMLEATRLTRAGRLTEATGSCNACLKRAGPDTTPGTTSDTADPSAEASCASST